MRRRSSAGSRAPASRRCSPRIRPRCSARASRLPARDRPALRESLSGKRRGAACRNPAALAHGDAARHAARGGRRGGERARLLPAHVPERAAAALRRARARAEGTLRLPAEPRLPPFLTVGTWIGGDRDGNPYVDAAVMRGALAQQAALILTHYLEETGHLYKELALRRASAPCRPGSKRLPPRRARAPPTGATSPTGARCRASTRASRRPRVACRREGEPPATSPGRLRKQKSSRRPVSGLAS